MIKIPHIHNLEWDSMGWLDSSSIPYSYTQKDWNQTILTKINQASVKIFQESLRGGANTLRFNSKVLTLIKTLEYYSEEENKVGYKYKIEIDDLIFENSIYIYKDSVKRSDILIPLDRFNGEVTIEHLADNRPLEIGDVHYKTTTNTKEIYEFKKRLICKLDILNYES